MGTNQEIARDTVTKLKNFETCPNLTELKPTSNMMFKGTEMVFADVFSCDKHWVSVSKRPHNRGKNTRNDKSSHGRIEATELSRMLKTLDHSDKRALIECE